MKALVKVNHFTSGSLDRNGKQPVILSIIAGKSPNRNVLSGTVAENAGFEVGKTYLASVREVEPNEYGRQFVWEKLGEPSTLEIIEVSDKLGEPQVFDVGVKANSEMPVAEEAFAEEK